METEPGEADVAEEESRERPEDTPDRSADAGGEPERRIDEDEPEELEDPERHGAGPATEG